MKSLVSVRAPAAAAMRAGAGLTGHRARAAVPRGAARLCCRAAAEAEGSSLGNAASRVCFKIARHVEFGQEVHVTGANTHLGGWEETKPLRWTDGDIWTGECDIAAGPTEYKYVIKTVRGELVEWQPGSNRQVFVPEDDAVVVEDQWEESAAAAAAKGLEHVANDAPYFAVEATAAAADAVADTATKGAEAGETLVGVLAAVTEEVLTETGSAAGALVNAVAADAVEVLEAVVEYSDTEVPPPPSSEPPASEAAAEWAENHTEVVGR